MCRPLVVFECMRKRVCVSCVSVSVCECVQAVMRDAVLSLHTKKCPAETENVWATLLLSFMMITLFISMMLKGPVHKFWHAANCNAMQTQKLKMQTHVRCSVSLGHFPKVNILVLVIEVSLWQEEDFWKVSRWMGKMKANGHDWNFASSSQLCKGVKTQIRQNPPLPLHWCGQQTCYFFRTHKIKLLQFSTCWSPWQ